MTCAYTYPGSNAYSCSSCGTKQSARKGLALTSLPAILALQLKRFDMNWDTGARIKITQAMYVPTQMDMAPYVHMEGQGQTATQTATSSTSSAPTSSDEDVSMHDAVVDDESNMLYELYSILMHTGSATGGHYFAYIKVSDHVVLYATCSDMCAYVSSMLDVCCMMHDARCTMRDADVYIHAQQNFGDNLWYDFDDTHVTPIAPENVQLMFQVHTCTTAHV